MATSWAKVVRKDRAKARSPRKSLMVDRELQHDSCVGRIGPAWKPDALCREAQVIGRKRRCCRLRLGFVGATAI